MTTMFRNAFVLCAALALAACYITTKPLITTANAAWPLTAGMTFKSFSWKDDKHVWEQSGSGAILRTGDHYTLHPDPEAGQAPDPGDDMDFLVSDLGDGYFAAQSADKDGTIMMDVIKIDGDTVYQYVLMCEPDDQKLAAQGIIAKYNHEQYSDTCTVDSLDQLKRAFHAKLDAGMVPHAKYVKTQ